MSSFLTALMSREPGDEEEDPDHWTESFLNWFEKACNDTLDSLFYEPNALALHTVNGSNVQRATERPPTRPLNKELDLQELQVTSKSIWFFLPSTGEVHNLSHSPSITVPLDTEYYAFHFDQDINEHDYSWNDEQDNTTSPILVLPIDQQKAKDVSCNYYFINLTNESVCLTCCDVDKDMRDCDWIQKCRGFKLLRGTPSMQISVQTVTSSQLVQLIQGSNHYIIVFDTQEQNRTEDSTHVLQSIYSGRLDGIIQIKGGQLIV